MATQPRHALPTVESIASYVAKNAGNVKKAQTQIHHDMQSVRETKYQGHRVVVRTWYEIEVDGKKIMGHVGVTNDGQVHYHPVPNLSFASAIEMVEKLIDIFPEDFKKNGRSGEGQHHMSPNKAASKSPKPKKTGT